MESNGDLYRQSHRQPQSLKSEKSTLIDSDEEKNVTIGQDNELNFETSSNNQDPQNFKQSMTQSDNQIEERRINQINNQAYNSRQRSNKYNLLRKNQKRDNKLLEQASGRRDIIMGSNYLKAFQKFEKCEGYIHSFKEQNLGKSNASGHDLLVSYFCTVGMDEADILHTAMSVKELEFTGYGLNNFQYDDLLANGFILQTDKSNNIKYLPQFQIPKFMPHILTRVPLIDRSKLLFPINLADFVYPDGIHAISAQEVLTSKKLHREKMSVPQPVGPDAAFLDSLPIPPLGDKIYDKETFRYNSSIEKHFQLTNQENKNYSATCYEYYVDLKHLSDTFDNKKRFNRYLKQKEIEDINQKISLIENQINQKVKEKLIERQASKIKQIEKEINRLLHDIKHKKQELEEVERVQIQIQRIIDVQIPKGRYFIPFSMVIVSQKPYRRQFQRILDAVYRNYTSGQLQNIGLSIEEVINRIVFGIRRPLKNLDYLNYAKNHKQIESQSFELQKYVPKMITKVVLNLQESRYSEERWDDIYFRNETVFDHQFSELSNICALLCRMPSENLLQIFKRLLFNKCTILQSDDHLTVEMAIKGIVQLFYPLLNGIVCVPQLPETNLEYVSLCNQAIIGVVKSKHKIQLKEHSISSQNIQEFLKNFQNIQKNKNISKRSHQAANYLLKTDKIFQKVLDQLNEDELKDILRDCIERLSYEEKNLRQITTTRSSEKFNNQMGFQQNAEQDEIFDIMIDNSCFMALNNSHPTQKPKQSVCFNSMGKMIHGQGASQRVSQKYKANENNRKQDPARSNMNRILAEADTLSDLELPRMHIQAIKELISQLQQFQEKQKYIVDTKMNDLKILYLEAKDKYQDFKKSSELDNINKAQEHQSINLKRYHISIKLIKKKQEEIHRSLFEVLQRIHQVKFRFFKMMQEIISAYTDENILKDFNKIRNNSKDQKLKLIEWRKKIQIFTLVDRKEFKNKFENNHNYKLHEKLIYFPSIQNFLVSKYFPVSQSENLRQIHILKKFEIKEKIEVKNKELYLKNDSSKLYDNKMIEDNDVLYLFRKNNPKNQIHEEVKYQSTKIDQLQWADADYEEKCYFPHILSEQELCKDFINNYRQEKIGVSQEDYYSEFNHYKGLKSEIAPVKDLSQQQINFLMHQSLKTDVGISCLLLFIGSLDYNLDPYIFQSFNIGPYNIKNEQARFKPPAFYESQRHLQMILAEYLQSAMMFLIENQNYDFNHRCPILALLYQNTHKYHYLHQTLLNIVNQEIDQLVTVATPASLPNASGSGGQGTMTVGSNFTVYQLHWQDKQLRLSQGNQQKYYKRQISHKKEIVSQEYQYLQKKVEDQIIMIKKREYQKDFEEYKKNYNYRIFCPYTLNILNKDDWFYSEERLDHLRQLKKDMISRQQKSKQDRKDIVNLQKQIESLQSFYNHQSDEPLAQKRNLLQKLNIFKRKNPQKVDQELKKEEQEVISDLSQKLSEINNDLIDGETRQKNLEKLYDSNKQFVKNDNDLFNKSDLNSKFFKPLSQRSRSFLSAKQIHDSVIKQACATDLFTDQNKLILTNEQFESVQMKLLMVTQLQCETCKLVKDEAELFDFVAGDRKNNQSSKKNDVNPQDARKNDAALRTFNCSTPDCDGQIKGKIHIKLIGTLGEISVLNVPLYNPLYIRFNIELLLQMDNSYKVINQIDISAFSQDGQPKELYWNAIFWFRYFGLPYQFLAPYSQHLNWYMTPSSVRENNHNLSESACLPSEFQIDDSNPKKTMIQILLKKLKHDQIKKSSYKQSQTPGEEEMSFETQQLDESLMRDNQGQFEDEFALALEPNNKAVKKVSEMTDDEKKQLALKIYRERKENRQRKVNSSNNQN